MCKGPVEGRSALRAAITPRRADHRGIRRAKGRNLLFMPLATPPRGTDEANVRLAESATLRPLRGEVKVKAACMVSTCVFTVTPSVCAASQDG